MISENTINGITWIDLVDPQKSDISAILDRYSIDIPAKNILDFEMLPQLHSDSSVHYCVLRFPRLYTDKTHEHRTSFEVDFILSKNVIISIHNIPLFEIHNVRTQMLSSTSELHTPNSALSLFGILITEFYATTRRQLHEIQEQLEHIELQVFGSFERSLLLQISKIAKHLIDIERSVHTDTPVMKQISTLNSTVNSKNITIAIELFSEIKTLIETNRLILEELRKTHQNMIAYNTTYAIRNLSIITFLALPIKIIVDTLTIYNLPNISDSKHVILGGVAVITILLIIYFRQRKWL